MILTNNQKRKTLRLKGHVSCSSKVVPYRLRLKGGVSCARHSPGCGSWICAMLCMPCIQVDSGVVISLSQER